MEELFIQELMSASENSSDDDNIVATGPITPRPSIENFIRNVVDRYTDEEFRNNFRMCRSTFTQVLTLIQDKIATEMNAVGHHTVSSKVQLLIALWYLATPDSYRSICGRFNIGKATGLRCLRRVVNALFEIGPTIIRWPTVDNIDEIIDQFNEKGFPGTIGAIDGMHIRIPQPADHGSPAL